MLNSDITPVIAQVVALVKEHYVFPEIGADVGEVLNGQLGVGRYAEVADLPSFAALVTEDLQSVNGDKHLRVLHHVDEVVDDGDDAAEEAAYRRRCELTAGGMARVERLGGNVGYLDIRPILFGPDIAGDRATAALSLLATTDALILDLRGCLGGSPDMVALVCSYLFDAEPVHLNDLVTPSSGEEHQYWTTPYVPGRRFGGSKPIWVLTSATTFSGAEELSYNLQQHGRATIVGERTRGGAHPRRGFKVHPHLEATISIARARNPVSGINWEGTGVAPDVEVSAEAAYAEAYRRALEHVLTLADAPGRREVTDEAKAALALLG